jgi:hypothetical protein
VALSALLWYEHPMLEKLMQRPMRSKFFISPSDSRTPNSPWITDRDLQQFHSDGYMVIRKVVPAHLIRAAVVDITAFMGADLRKSATWYNGAPELDGIVPLHHAQSLWDIRQSPNVHQVFSEFFRTERLTVDMNRCIFRPPINPRYSTISYGTIHWDTDPKAAGPGALQAVVLLSDIGPNTGGFQCIPDVYQNLDAWLEQNASSEGFDFFNPGLNDRETIQVTADAGDVILWSTKLPHGSASNLSTRPRIAAFISMGPFIETDDYRDSMREWWLTKRAPRCWRGLPGQLDPEPGEPAMLSDLGLKLIGVSPW